MINTKNKSKNATRDRIFIHLLKGVSEKDNLTLFFPLGISRLIKPLLLL
jgi:hypothetical protein